MDLLECRFRTFDNLNFLFCGSKLDTIVGSQHHRTQSTLFTMGLKYLGAKAAAALDKELMSSGAFSIDQLMELAGLSVSQAGTPLLLSYCNENPKLTCSKVFRVQPPSSGRRILVACGPGNNGLLTLLCSEQPTPTSTSKLRREQRR